VKRRVRDRLAGLVIGLVLVVAAACGDDINDDINGDGSDPESDPAVAADREPSEWLHLGGDLAHTRAASDETTVGPDNAGALQPAWELSDVTGVTGTPIIADGVVYIGDWTGRLWVLDAETGDEIWTRDLDTSRIQAAVAIDDDRVFVGAFDPRIVALDRETGDEVWQATVDDHPMASVFGSPIHVDGLVIVGVASYENVAGAEDFSFRGSVVALDAATGDEVWRYWTTEGDDTEGPGVSVWSTPAVDLDREHVYVGTGQHYAEPTTERSDAIIALDLTTGEEQWVHQYTAGDVWVISEPGEGLDADIGAPPNLFQVGDTDAVGAGDKDGVYKALDRDTGEELWSTDLTEGGLQGGVMASAAVHDGSIYVMSNEASTTSELFALEQDTGEIRWQSEVGSLAVGPVTWANGVVYVADNTGNISGFDADSGERLWAHQTEGEAAGGIAVADGTVYAGYGWWLFGAPDEPKGGLIAFRVNGTDADDATARPAGEVSGADVYRQSCATCHGADGEGGNAPPLVGVDDRLTVDESIEIVRQGSGPMPAWEGTLSPEVIDAVVDYIHSELSGDS
jgi:polyvinyl alcohol dehydrogenase (cytochrome)